MDCEKNGKCDVTWSLPPLPLSQTVTLSQTPSPLWSVTYFMDGPLWYITIYRTWLLLKLLNFTSSPYVVQVVYSREAPYSQRKFYQVANDCCLNWIMDIVQQNSHIGGSARIVPNEVGVWLHLLRNLYGWGAWMWGQLNVCMERWGVDSRGGESNPRYPSNSSIGGWLD